MRTLHESRTAIWKCGRNKFPG